MTLYDRIIAIYPELSLFDFAAGIISLRNDSDGQGDYIDKWEHPTLARPTQEMLDAITEPVIPVPQSVTPAQGLMALYTLKGITEDDILAAIDTIEDPALRYQALISYKKATVWERPSVSMQVVAGLLALTEPDQDELFTLAATYANL